MSVNQRMPEHLSLPGENEVHVWTVLVSETLANLANLEGFLSLDEIRIAARLRRPVDRDRYVVAHGILRRLLGAYLSLAPEELVFTTGEFGKPAIVLGAKQPSLTFNLAHSGDIVLFGVAVDRRLGVDVEAIRSELDVMELAQSQFSTIEIDGLRSFSPNERIQAFFRGWTRKEAYIKARGEGLNFPLNRFAVTLKGEEVPRLQWVENEPEAPRNWSMFHLDLLPGYAGALVVEGQKINLVSYIWPVFS
jgi:4'-phosphopantetheinyl transferase